jgi:hypothetical protein
MSARRAASLRSGLLVLAAGLVACGKGDNRPPCGLSAVVGPSVLLNEFTTAGQTLAKPPDVLPEKLVTRLAAGFAFSSIVGRADSQWVIGVNGTLPAETQVSFGVLVMDKSGAPLGVMLYESSIIEGAPVIGTVSIGRFVVPLIGVQVEPSRIQDPNCPLFPDSLAQ